MSARAWAECSARFRRQRRSGAPAGALFFYRGPLHPLPLADGFFVSFDSPTFGPLATETQGAEDPPHMTGIVLHSGQVFDEAGNPGQSPKLRLVTQLDWPLEQGSNDLV